MTTIIASDKKVKVHGFWASPFSCRVQIALTLKGIPYEYIEEDLSNKSPELLQYNPITKLIPVLLHNGKSVVESLVITEYIDDTWKHNPLLPLHPHERAVARFWAKFIDDKCLHPLRMACWGNGEVRDKAIKESHTNLKTLEDHLKEDDQRLFFGGDSVGFVDIAGIILAHWTNVMQEVGGVELITEDKYPVLCKWIVDLNNCHVVKEHLPSRDKLFHLFTARLDRLKATQSNKELYG